MVNRTRPSMGQPSKGVLLDLERVAAARKVHSALGSKRTTSAKAPGTDLPRPRRVQQVGEAECLAKELISPAKRGLVLAMEQIEGQAQGGLKPGNTVRRALSELLFLFVVFLRVGSVIRCGDAIDGAVEQSLEHGAAIGFCTQGGFILALVLFSPTASSVQHENDAGLPHR